MLLELSILFLAVLGLIFVYRLKGYHTQTISFNDETAVSDDEMQITKISSEKHKDFFGTLVIRNVSPKKKGGELLEVKPVVVGEKSFINNNNMQYLVSTGWVSFESFSFFQCQNLIEVKIEGSGKGVIGKNAFHRCMNLQKAHIEGMSEINNLAFSRCGSLLQVILKNIGKIECSFQSCPSLAELCILGGVSHIKSNAFSRYGLFHKIDHLPPIQVIISGEDNKFNRKWLDNDKCEIFEL